MDRQIQIVGCLNDAFNIIRRAGIRRVRRHHGSDSAVCLAVPLSGEADGLLQLPVLLLRRTQADDAPGQDSPDSGFLHSLGNLVHMVIHIHEGGRAALHHLQDGEQCSDADILCRIFGFVGPNPL
ncbi:hypothetical protein D3C75_934850 [compost metagenome]